jgi:hypothetical protein
MLPPTLDILVEKLGKLPQLQWVRSYPSDTDIDAIKEAGQESVFDPLRLRATMLKEGGQIQCRDLYKGRKHLARVLVVCEKGRKPVVPWLLYSKIFQAFGQCVSGTYWRVILFASSIPRQFPDPGVQPSQEHLNGGYAYPGNPQSVVIYRQEESHRVLVHELLHACGSDDINKPEWLREALTETWAELFLIAILANGSAKKAQMLWDIQSQWIVDQETILTQEHNVRVPEDYAYRYTVGRRDVLNSLGLPLPQPSPDPRSAVMGSLRFTSPVLSE